MPTHRPYSKDPNSPPSVTTIIGTLDKPGMTWAAAKETAAYAVHHAGKWMSEPDHVAENRLRRHHRGVWDHRALLGTAVHSVLSAWARDEDIKVGDLLARMRLESRLWAGYELSELYAHIKPFLAALTHAWAALEPETLGADEILRYPVAGVDYIGTSDWRCQSLGKRLLVDLKTTGKGVDRDIPDSQYRSWRLQLAAYRQATELLSYGTDADVVSVDKAPEVDEAAVLLVRGDATWELMPVPADEDDWQAFLNLRRVYGWANSKP